MFPQEIGGSVAIKQATDGWMRCCISRFSDMLETQRHRDTKAQRGTDPLAAFGGVSPSVEGENELTLPSAEGETPPKAARGSVPLCAFVLRQKR